MKRLNAWHLDVITLFFASMFILYSCGSSTPNTSVNTVSSAFATIVTCPTTTVKAVAISNFAFQPGTITVAVNDIVRWTNNDTTTDHTVTSGSSGVFDGKFDTGHIVPNTPMCVQFLVGGLYPYFCTLHPFMTGTVTVQ